MKIGHCCVSVHLFSALSKYQHVSCQHAQVTFHLSVLLGLDLEVEGRVVEVTVLHCVGPVRGPGLHVGAGGGRGSGAVASDREGGGQEAEEEGERGGHAVDSGGLGHWGGISLIYPAQLWCSQSSHCSK